MGEPRFVGRLDIRHNSPVSLPHICAAQSHTRPERHTSPHLLASSCCPIPSHLSPPLAPPLHSPTSGSSPFILDIPVFGNPHVCLCARAARANAGNTETGASGCEGGGRRENLEALEGGLAAGRLVLHHGADGAPDHARGRTEVEGTTAGVGVLLLLEDRHEQQLVADEAATHTYRKREGAAISQLACCNPLERHAERHEQGGLLHLSVSLSLPSQTPLPSYLPEMLTSSQRTSTTR
jgi:hypothetical protein